MTFNDDGAPLLSRRQILVGGIALALLGHSVLSREAQAQDNPRTIANARLETMSDHNMPPGFSRSKIIADMDGAPRLIGSIFVLEDSRARADFITAKKHPQFFDEKGRPDFSAIAQRRKAAGNHPVMLVAGAYLASGETNRQIDGIALENGEMVGGPNPIPNYNGILVIRDGVPSIEYYNQIPDFNHFLEEAKQKGWDVFQQTSFIRPGGTFSSSNTQRYELRFFVEGEGKKAVINLTEAMTYNEALHVMQNLAGFRIEKAICLDTGLVSEGYFYDASGQDHLMIDERFDKGTSYTNLLELYSTGM